MVKQAKETGRDAEALTQKGANLTFLGRYAEGLSLFEKAIALEPGLVRAHGGRAVSLARMGRAEDGLASAEEAIRLDPADALSYTALGFCLQRLGRDKEARSAYETALAKGPENPRVLYNCACYRAELGDEEKCREFLTRVFQYLESGDIEHSKKDRDLAPYIKTDWFDRLRAAAKLLDEGISHFLEGRYAEALAAFDRTLGVTATHVRARAGRAFALAQLGRAREGLAAAKEVIRQNPNYGRGHSALAICFHRLRRPGEAQAAYEHAVKLAPDDATGLYNFACFWAEVGDEGRCREYLKKALRYDDGRVAQHATKDPDMARYRNADWFRELIAAAKRKGPAVSRTKLL
jgi:tetratricopeptide (TPR) repeat protein